MVLKLRESASQSVSNAPSKVPTGWKGNARAEVDQAVCRLQHQKIMSRVQAGREGLGCGEAPRFWYKATRKKRKKMVVTRLEEERYIIKAVSQGLLGGWTTWKGVGKT